MLSRKLVFWGACLVLTRAWADPAPTEYPAPIPSLQVSLRNEEFIGGENHRQVQRVYVTSGTNQFAFTVPDGFRADASNPQKIVLSDVSCTYFIVLRFAGPMTAASDALQIDAYRNLALRQFPGAKISSEFSEFAANHSCPAFDLQWINSGGSEQAARFVYIPTAAGVLEFSLLTSSKNLEGGRNIFKVLLASLRTNEGGKLTIIRLPDQS